MFAKWFCFIFLSTAAFADNVLPAEKLAQMQALWKLKCTLDSTVVVNAIQSREVEFVTALRSSAPNLKLQAELLTEDVAFYPWANLYYKLGVLVPLHFRDGAAEYTVQTRTRDKDGFFTREGAFLQFNPIETGKGHACGLDPIRGYAIYAGQEKYLPTYQLLDSAKSVQLSSNLGLYQEKILTPVRRSPTPSHWSRPSRRTFGACGKKTIDDIINRRPCFYFIEPCLDPLSTICAEYGP